MVVSIKKRHFVIGLIFALLLGLYARDQAITATNADPQINAFLNDLTFGGSSFWGSGWTPNESVEIEVYDFPDGEIIVGPQTLAVDSEGNFWTPPITILIPDMFLRVKDVATSTIKELMIPLLEITSNNHETNVVEGLAPPGTNVWIEIDGTDFGINAISDINGHWEVDFTGLFDLEPEDTVTLYYWDEDHDRISVFETPIWAGNPPLYLQGGYDNDWMEFYFYSPANTMTYQVLDSEGTLLSTGEVQTNVKGWAHISRGIHGIEFQPGYQIIGIDHRRNISDTITMQAITTDMVDYDTDDMAGTAPPNAEIRINIGCPEEDYNIPDQADVSGNWSIGLMTEHGIDLTTDCWVYSSTFDENHNSTFAALDEDGDQTGNGIDNAMLIFNPDQSDLDEDTVGDVADPCPSILDDSCNPDRSGAVSINQNGGILNTLEGDTSVIVPSGSLSTDTSISITDTGEGYLRTASPMTVLSNSPEIWAVFSNFIGPSSITVTVPISITFTWDDTNNDGIVDNLGIDENDLIIYHGDSIVTDYCEFEYSCDPESNHFVFTTTILGDFALVGEKTSFLVYLPSAFR